MNMGCRSRVVACALVWAGAAQSQPASPEPASASRTHTYSQKTLLKNYAFAACLATAFKDPAVREDAGAAASAYVEFGHQPIEAYEPLRALAEQYANRTYAGSIASEFNTMKCVDLFNSRQLDRLAGKLAKRR